MLLHDHPMLAHLLHGKPLVSLLVTNQVDSTGGRGERGGGRERREREILKYMYMYYYMSLNQPLSLYYANTNYHSVIYK